MLTITVPLAESYDEKQELFIVTEAFKLELEHSLVSLSKWESKFEKPFLSNTEKTAEETLAYIQIMTLTPNVPPEIFHKLTQKNVAEINDYINAKTTATTFREVQTQSKRQELITSEIIYYWMLSLNIDMDCQHWHLNKLITLIRVTSEKNSPAKKTSRADLARERHRMNMERKQRLGTRG